jgi:hypothetical protein
VIRKLSGSSGDFPTRPSLRGATRTEARKERADLAKTDVRVDSALLLGDYLAWDLLRSIEMVFRNRVPDLEQASARVKRSRAGSATLIVFSGLVLAGCPAQVYYTG